MRKLAVDVERRALNAPFRISGKVFEHLDLVVVTVSEGVHHGRGEAAGVYYVGDDVPAMLKQIDDLRDAVEAGAGRGELIRLQPAGGARNAIDCALWELEAYQAGLPVWALAGLAEPKPVRTTMTLGADDPEVMAEAARRLHPAQAIKLKLTGDLLIDIARVRAVRLARPKSWIAVDANQGYERPSLRPLSDAMSELGIALIEQPIRRGDEGALDHFVSDIPLAADESVLDMDDLPHAIGRFQIVNIKLDKCGGLTAALALHDSARSAGLEVMVGNMIGTSLAMAPAFLLAQRCAVVDLDGPIFLSCDRQPAVIYQDGLVSVPSGIWGP